MKCTITKVFNVHNQLIAFFDANIAPYAKKTGKTELGDIEILTSENGRQHSFSAVIKTKIPFDSLEGLQIGFID